MLQTKRSILLCYYCESQCFFSALEIETCQITFEVFCTVSSHFLVLAHLQLVYIQLWLLVCILCISSNKLRDDDMWLFDLTYNVLITVTENNDFTQTPALATSYITLLAHYDIVDHVCLLLHDNHTDDYCSGYQAFKWGYTHHVCQWSMK